MPYYRWQGVFINAQSCKGRIFARDAQALRAMLFEQGIAVTHYKELRYFYLLPISSESKQLFFDYIYDLTRAGIHISQALVVIAERVVDGRLARVALDLADGIQQGYALHESLAAHSIFSYEAVHIIRIGSDAGNMHAALHMLCSHMKSTQAFKNRLRQALFLPICTFAFFVVSLFVVLLLVIPRYAKLFSSMSKELPYMTRVLLQISSFVGSYYFFGTLIILGTIIAVLVKIIQIPHYKYLFDRRVLSMPIVGPFVKEINLIRILRSLALLLKAGMPLVPALEIVQEAVASDYIKELLADITKQVQAGNDLSVALQRYGTFFPQDIIILITLGQETGKLADMVQRAADMYTAKVDRTLHRCTLIIQPAIMVVLGICVALLICAVYIPLFNLADLS